MSQPETMTAAQFAALLKAHGNDLRKIGKVPKNAAPTYRPLPPEPDLPPIRWAPTPEARRLPPAPVLAVGGLGCRARALATPAGIGIAVATGTIGNWSPVSTFESETLVLTYWTKEQALQLAAQIVEACK